MFRSKALAVFLFASLFSACSRDSKNEAQAPLFIGDSFTVSKAHESDSKDTLVGIKKESLNKEFILQGELIQQPVVAKFSNIKSRIVFFRKKDARINMMEAVDGHTSSTSLPQNILLASFKIIKEENGVFYFNFSEGMSKIFMVGDWYASDSSGRSYDAERQWKSVDIDTSYIEEVKADNFNNLVMRQIALIKSARKVDTSEGDTTAVTINVPVEVRYYLAPYIKNEGFISRESPPMQKVGYFEVAPRLTEDGGSKLYASRWDERKPITYSISSNTPPEFVQAIKDGVLYWNKAFGKEVLHVDMAPEGVLAPDFQYNMIQWVDWKDAGYAYADAQMDPRTGEILHASVFLTSVFGFNALHKARQIMRRLAFEKAKSPGPAPQVSLQGFQQTHLCDFEFESDFSIELAKIIDGIEKGTDTESSLLKLAQDTVREAVAHEIGHTLGLRHNFAGSLETKVPNNKRDDVFKEYLVTGNAPEDMTTSSSVMDYQNFQDSLLTGDHILKLKTALEYDSKAIQQLYFDIKADKMPLFCTDSQVGKFLDCATFDYGPSVFDFILLSEKKAFDNLPYTLMEKIILEKSKGVNVGRDLRKVIPSSSSIALEAMKPRITFLKALTENAQFLNVERGTSGDDNTSYLVKEITKNGGIDAFLSHTPASKNTEMEKLFQELLKSDVYTTGHASGGAFVLTSEEKSVLSKVGKYFFMNMALVTIPAELMLYTLPMKFRGDVFASELSKNFLGLMTYVLESSTGTISGDIINPDGTKVSVEVPEFNFPDWLRKKAAGILTDRSEDPMWGLKAKSVIKRHFKELITTSLKSIDIEKIDVSTVSNDTLGGWILMNKKILEDLN